MQAFRLGPVLRCRRNHLRTVARLGHRPQLSPSPSPSPSPSFSSSPASLTRSSSSAVPPHKEYFQTPGQAPLPDTSPYNPNEPIRTYPAAAGAAGAAAAGVTTERSWAARGFRSVLWALLFGTIGIGAGVGLITWEYLQPAFEPGSDEEAELFEEIVETLNVHPLSEDLRNEGWIEEEFYTTTHRNRSSSSSSSISNGGVSVDSKGANLIHDTLTGPRGLEFKAFRHPTLNYTILLVFTGFSVEGWPDTVHGGVIASMMIEGAQRHLNTFYRNRGLPDITLDENQEAWSFNIDYKKPLRTGEVYAIVIPPGGFGPSSDGRRRLSSSSLLPQPSFKLAALAMALEAAPRVRSDTDLLSGTITHTLEIPSSSSATDIPHAVATVEIHLGPGSEKAEKAEKVKEQGGREREEESKSDQESESEPGVE